MSAVKEGNEDLENWGWQFTTINDVNKADFDILLLNRMHENDNIEKSQSKSGSIKMLKTKLGLDVEILGGIPDARIPGLEGPRAACQSNGIFEADTILVPLEDGDRCEALVAMGKEVLVIDLNPLSRSSRRGTVGIVDEVTRVTKNLIQLIPQRPEPTEWNNNHALQSALNHITSTMATRFQ